MPATAPSLALRGQHCHLGVARLCAVRRAPVRSRTHETNRGIAVVTRAGPPREPDDPPKRSDGDAGSFDAVIRTVGSTWSKLDTQQRVYAVVAGAAVTLALPQIVAILLIPLERLLIGGLLAIEEVIALLLLQSARVAALLGLVALVLGGAYVFLFPKKQREP